MASAWVSLSLKRAISADFGIVLCANDPDDLIDVEVRDEQPLENVQALLDARKTILEPTSDCLLAKFEPVGKQTLEIVNARQPVESDDVHVDALRSLQRGRGEQVRHQRIRIDIA